MFEVVFLRFEVTIDGVDDAAVGSVGEGGDFFFDGLQRLVEILGASGGQRAAAHNRAHKRTESAEPAKSAYGTGAGHCLGPGCGPVYPEQQGVCTGVNSINSIRVSSGS